MRPREEESDPAWREVVACRDLARFEARERLRFLAGSDDGALVASVERLHPDWRRRSFALARWERTGAQRQGQRAEAVGAVTRHAFGTLAARRVIVGHAAPNAASARLIARLGFARVSRMPPAGLGEARRLVRGGRGLRADRPRAPPLDARWGA